jgi:(2Fe-2S) ferredoxin
MPTFEKHVFICTNRREPGHARGSCAERGGEALKDRFKQALAKRGLKEAMRANAAGCLDQCEQGCTVVVYPEQAWYGHVTPDDVEEIVETHLVGGKLVERLLLPDQPHLGRK